MAAIAAHEAQLARRRERDRARRAQRAAAAAPAPVRAAPAPAATNKRAREPAHAGLPECAVCMDASAVVKFGGCVHVCTCEACAKKCRGKCPVCRKQFKKMEILVFG